MLTNHVSKAVFQGNGVTTQFPFTFKVWKAEQLALKVVNSQGAQQPLSPWTVELSDSGGTLHYSHSNAPLPAGYTLAVLRNMPFTQEINLVSGTRFDPAVIEAQMDKATAERQQLREELERTVKVSATATYEADDLLNEIMDAHMGSKNSAAAALQSEQNAQANANTTAQLLQNTVGEANRAKAEADRAAAEANLEVDDVSITKNLEHILTVKTYSLQNFEAPLSLEEKNFPASLESIESLQEALSQRADVDLNNVTIPVVVDWWPKTEAEKHTAQGGWYRKWSTGFIEQGGKITLTVRGESLSYTNVNFYMPFTQIPQVTVTKNTEQRPHNTSFTYNISNTSARICAGDTYNAGAATGIVSTWVAQGY